ncbi:hypothetical protein [Halarcobacter ebronensis]|uniref:Zona occludens toxin N-terminal domain-containing protein n=1 Tax=Halarcobacter ebronensis TaxID=1462615 RepID=A0A4Q1AJ92_9BACT|nr:hypothetical protein [Halarcobacter ebronensis]QKF82049.1 hypothetical protein AEBR_1566 [Halarcobacter ebronensis]RXK04117.1 hypothetical protein CRV07_11870 [Halarcobacter ebronensis]
MRTATQNNVYLFMGDKGDGKTTNATALMEILNRPTVIFDVAAQFGKNDYRLIANGYQQLYYYLNNPKWLKAIRKANLQIVVRFSKNMNKREEIEKCSQLLWDFKHITIVYEEMDLYFVYQASTQNPIYETLYLSRNREHEVICIYKQATAAHEVIKQNADYIITSNIESANALKFFERRDKNLPNLIKNLKFREFLIIGKRGYRRVHKLKKSIAQML